MANPLNKNNNFDMPFKKILREEWVYGFGGALCAFAVASILISGSLIPLLSTPFSYTGDSLFTSWGTQRVMEDWLFENPRSGFPFGSQFLDFPGADFANLFLLKIFGFIAGSFHGAMNLYFLIGFFVTFIFSYLVFRKLGLTIIFSLAGAFAFDFLPFHFMQLIHLYLYLVVCCSVILLLGVNLLSLY